MKFIYQSALIQAISNARRAHLEGDYIAGKHWITIAEWLEFKLYQHMFIAGQDKKVG
jgi:hypothetical protein